ncbi:hypothetical protein HID58_003037 [Brassica napus]|uniref:Protein kinase domain-containing protein n=1 Tax=Brassica napus TaxID=3708 RepID=A0ABQ8ENZ5_BRANA|nr:hypothetical protein HID58_003037 [Brassica napus]
MVMIQPAFTVFATITTSPNLHVGINLDRCYINMEFASKGSLHNDSKLFTPRDTFTVIKPANVLLFPSKTFGEQWDLKLADFGLSKEPGTDSSRSYMPPESLGLNGVNMVGPSVDMWSLGCLVAVQRRWEIATPWRLPRLVSPVANDFFRKWMEVQPSRRATAADLLKHLFVAPHRVVRSVIPLSPDQMYCPPAIIRYARRQGGPMMMMMTMAPPRPGDLIC